MLLAIDVGNTNIVIGVFDGEKLKVTWRIATRLNREVDEYGIVLRGLFVHQRLTAATSPGR